MPERALKRLSRSPTKSPSGRAQGISYTDARIFLLVRNSIARLGEVEAIINKFKKDASWDHQKLKTINEILFPLRRGQKVWRVNESALEKDDLYSDTHQDFRGLEFRTPKDFIKKSIRDPIIQEAYDPKSKHYILNSWNQTNSENIVHLVSQVKEFKTMLSELNSLAAKYISGQTYSELQCLCQHFQTDIINNRVKTRLDTIIDTLSHNVVPNIADIEKAAKSERDAANRNLEQANIARDAVLDAQQVAEAAQLTRDLEGVERAQATVEVHVAELEGERNETQVESNRLTTRVSELEAAATQTQDQLVAQIRLAEEVGARVAELEGQLMITNQEKEAAIASAVEINEDRNRLQQVLAKEMEDKISLEEQLARLGKEIDVLREDLRPRQARIAELENQLEIKNNRLIATKAEREKVKEALAGAKDTKILGAAQKKVSDREGEIAEANNQVKRDRDNLVQREILLRQGQNELAQESQRLRNLEQVLKDRERKFVSQESFNKQQEKTTVGVQAERTQEQPEYRTKQARQLAEREQLLRQQEQALELKTRENQAELKKREQVLNKQLRDKETAIRKQLKQDHFALQARKEQLQEKENFSPNIISPERSKPTRFPAEPSLFHRIFTFSPHQPNIMEKLNKREEAYKSKKKRIKTLKLDGARIKTDKVKHKPIIPSEQKIAKAMTYQGEDAWKKRKGKYLTRYLATAVNVEPEDIGSRKDCEKLLKLGIKQTSRSGQEFMVKEQSGEKRQAWVRNNELKSQQYTDTQEQNIQRKMVTMIDMVSWVVAKDNVIKLWGDADMVAAGELFVEWLRDEHGLVDLTIDRDITRTNSGAVDVAKQTGEVKRFFEEKLKKFWEDSIENEPFFKEALKFRGRGQGYQSPHPY